MINSFVDTYHFLCNFYMLENPIQYGELSFPTSEHFYQGMKTLDLTARQAISEIEVPRVAKKTGQTIELRSNWNDIKFEVMKFGLILKFSSNPGILKQLIKTNDKHIVEGNGWHDNLWGNCICYECENITGQNLLGEALMEVREYFKVIGI